MTPTPILERWETDGQPFRITLAWEVLPSLTGTLHAVDPDPDAQFEHYPVSLCGKALTAKGGTVKLGEDTCAVCIEVSKERQAEFDAGLLDEDGAKV